MPRRSSEVGHDADPSDRERRERLVEVAWLHHEYGLTQEQIARRTGVSRSTISRALRDAEELGIVRVTVTEPLPREWHLSERLAESLGVVAHVGARPAGSATASPMEIAALAAARLIEQAADRGHITIATSWGRTLALAAASVRRRRTQGVVVIDAVGHAAGGAIAPALDVTRTLAGALEAAAVHLASPAYADPATHALLTATPVIATTLELARKADLILTSVGVVGPDSLLVTEGFVDDATMAALMARGATGEILGQYLDADGAPVPEPPLLTIGLSLADLHAARRVVAVAAGEHKADAIVAAVVGGVVTEVVVDERLAVAILERGSRAGTPPG